MVDQRSRTAFQKALSAHQQGQLAEAESLYLKALKFESNHFPALCNLANLLKDSGHAARSLPYYRKALQQRQDLPQLHFNHAHACMLNADHDAALKGFDTTVKLDARFLYAYLGKANSLMETGRLDEACDACQGALDLEPDNLDVMFAMGDILRRMARFDDAIGYYDRVLAAQPAHINALINKGVALHKSYRHASAIEVLQAAVNRDDNNALAHYNLGNVYLDTADYPSAMQSYHKAMQLAPGMDYLAGQYLHTQMQCCDWKAYQDTLAQIDRSTTVTSPFYLLATEIGSASLHAIASAYADKRYGLSRRTVYSTDSAFSEQIVLAYFSADFHNHATAHLISGLIREHDRKRFRVIAYSFGPVTDDDWQQQMRTSFDAFHDVSQLSDAEIAELARQHKVEIAVDLKGYTQSARAGIFAHAPAPVVVNYLGYPGTMGAEIYDYIIADPVVINDSSAKDYSESIVSLPGCYQPNDESKEIAQREFSRAELSLPDDVFVFACFNNTYKITPDVYALWMRILHHVPDSVLWLIDCSDVAKASLRQAASDAGVDAERVVFAERMPLQDHLARHRCADLFLDTLYYNAHTTASDALWTGLPLITLPGEQFASRVAASLLTALGVTSTIVETAEEYEDLAVKLAGDREALMALRQDIDEQLRCSSLFDTVRYTRWLESAYRIMSQRQRDAVQASDITADDIESSMTEATS